MNVVLISDYGYVDGGISHVLFDSIRMLVRAGVSVTFICGTERVDTKALPEGVKVFMLGMYDLISDPHRLRAIRNGIWNNTAEKRVIELLRNYNHSDTVIHVHSWSKIFSPSIFAALKKGGFKSFVTCHDYFVSCPNGAYYNYVTHSICHCRGGGMKCLFCNCDARSYGQKVWRWVRQQAIRSVLRRFADLRFVTLSERNERVLRSHFGGGRRYVRINNTVSASSLNSCRVKDKKSFFYAGRVSPEKGFDLFAKAVTDLGLDGVVVGAGAALDNFKERFPKLTYLGWCSHDEMMLRMHRNAAVLVFPSVCYETAGLTPLEAMSLGIPCIISDVTSAAEYIEDGKTGLLFKSGDEEDLKRKIEMMKDPNFREQMSENIRRCFDISKWSEEVHIAKLLAAYREALEEVK